MMFIYDVGSFQAEVRIRKDRANFVPAFSGAGLMVLQPIKLLLQPLDALLNIFLVLPLLLLIVLF
jgi:hypothetical protein